MQYHEIYFSLRFTEGMVRRGRGGEVYRIWRGLLPGAWVCTLPINFKIFNVANFQKGLNMKTNS